jgi:hypothetical protein
MRRLALALLIAAVPLHGQDPRALADIDEAFALAGVRGILEALPSHVNEMTSAAVAQFPREQRRQFEPVIKDVSRQFLAPDAFYRQLRANFAKRYDAAHMGTFLALEKTSVYRTMHRLEETAESPASQATRRRFEAALKNDPPPVTRTDALLRLDEARGTTKLQIRIVTGIVNAMSGALGATMPADLDTQTKAFSEKIEPVLANGVLHTNLFTYRNADDVDLQDYVAAAEQKDVAWFNWTLQAAIVAVASDRSTRAGEAIKAKVALQASTPTPTKTQ